jgi:hypothetical protein
MTLGAAAAAQVRLIVWCKACQHQVEPDPAEMAERYGADTSILDWRASGVALPLCLLWVGGAKKTGANVRDGSSLCENSRVQLARRKFFSIWSI